KTRGLILGLPIMLLVAIMATIFSWIGNFQAKVTTELIDPLAQAQQLLSISNTDQNQPQQVPELKAVAYYNDHLTDQQTAAVARLDGVTSITQQYNATMTTNHITIEGLEQYHFQGQRLSSLDPSLA